MAARSPAPPPPTTTTSWSGMAGSALLRVLGRQLVQQDPAVVPDDARPAAAVMELVHELAAPARVDDVVADDAGAVLLVVPMAIDLLATRCPLTREVRAGADHDPPSPSR